MSPDFESVKPSGNVVSPERFHESSMPPSDERLKLYASPFTAAGSELVVITVGSVTVSVISWLAIPRSFDA